MPSSCERMLISGTSTSMRMRTTAAVNQPHVPVNAWARMECCVLIFRLAGKSAFASGNGERATKAYRKAAELNVDGADHWLGLAEIAEAHNETDLAIEANTHLVRYQITPESRSGQRQGERLPRINILSASSNIVRCRCPADKHLQLVSRNPPAGRGSSFSVVGAACCSWTARGGCSYRSGSPAPPVTRNCRACHLAVQPGRCTGA